MRYALGRGEALGLLKPALDAHTLGLGSIGELLEGCGIRTAQAGRELGEALEAGNPGRLAALLGAWIRGEGLSALGLSYRLDPEDGARLFGALVEALKRGGLLAEAGGPIRGLYFAGLPPACELVAERFPLVSGLFRGEESPAECLEILGLSPSLLPPALAEGIGYDEERLAFGRELVRRADYLAQGPLERRYRGFGERGEGLARRLSYHAEAGLGPLLRAHVGPYLPDRREAISLFLDWTRELARAGLLDVLSIGSSQLTQEAFGEDWGGRPNGGGVPLATEEELAEVWRAARPMLVRAYSGVVRVAAMAEILERRLDIAWHALSLWWFCRLDGRGPNGVEENLREHLAALRYIASTGKPFEPNVPHHFAFRGADDLSYVLSGLVAAKAAKAQGIGSLVLQVMLNTPRQTQGLQDLAKARALLSLVRELEGPGFRVYLQPRGGLDYFSRDEGKARAQLAAVTALMDDIEPARAGSPEIIHVVSYSEGNRLADPAVVNESLRITRQALADYRRLRAAGGALSPAREAEVGYRAEALAREARALLGAMEASIPEPYSARGLHTMLKEGWFALPYLAELRGDYEAAASQRTRFLNGGVALVGREGRPLSAAERILAVEERRARGQA